LTRVLLIGGSGQLGTAIAQNWSHCEILAPARDSLDLENESALREHVERVRPDVLVNAAAFHDVDRCEDEPERAFAVNALAVARAARVARERDIVFVTFSTDYVFDGRAAAPYAEEDAPHPLSVYGTSKLAGEYLVESLRGRTFVVRTCGLYGKSSSRRSSFLERVLTHRPGDAPLRVVADVVASPTFAGHLAAAVWRLIASGAYGLYHAVNAGAVSWYEFACEAAAQASVDAVIEPIPASQWKRGARRPRFSALENRKLARLGIAMPGWRDGIAAYVQVR